MSFPRDLVEQAAHLAGIDVFRPKQANLRRAVSSAYYGLFHLLAEEVAFNFSKATPIGLRETVQRVLTHGEMKNVCKSLIAGDTAFRKNQKLAVPIATQRLLTFPIEEDLLNVMKAFIELQESRHSADYDSTIFWSRINVLTKIALVERAFDAWMRVKGSPNAMVFMGALIFQKQWAR